LRSSRNPPSKAHCLPDVFVRLPGSLEMIDESYPVETGDLGVLGPIYDVGNR
jgi:hypothetical protein